MHTINERMYQEIFDELSKYLTAEWDKLIVYLEYGNASYSFAFYIKAGDKYIKCTTQCLTAKWYTFFYKISSTMNTFVVLFDQIKNVRLNKKRQISA